MPRPLNMMKNQVQLITHVDRFSGCGFSDLNRMLKGPLAGVFGGIHLLPFFTPIDGTDAGFDPIGHTQVDARPGTWVDVRGLGGNSCPTSPEPVDARYDRDRRLQCGNLQPDRGPVQKRSLPLADQSLCPWQTAAAIQDMFPTTRRLVIRPSKSCPRVAGQVTRRAPSSTAFWICQRLEVTVQTASMSVQNKNLNQVKHHDNNKK